MMDGGMSKSFLQVSKVGRSVVRAIKYGLNVAQRRQLLSHLTNLNLALKINLLRPSSPCGTTTDLSSIWLLRAVFEKFITKSRDREWLALVQNLDRYFLTAKLLVISIKVMHIFLIVAADSYLIV